MDKATKLETIFDRIELVDTRFEIVRREIMANASGASRRKQIENGWNRWRTTDLPARLQSWRRVDVRRAMWSASDDRGSAASARRWRATPAAGRRGAEPDDRRGTLNSEERKVIEQHVVTTIDLLSELPFPPALRAVPEIAGSHHERVDGTGYPHGCASPDHPPGTHPRSGGRLRGVDRARPAVQAGADAERDLRILDEMATRVTSTRISTSCSRRRRSTFPTRSCTSTRPRSTSPVGRSIWRGSMCKPASGGRPSPVKKPVEIPVDVTLVRHRLQDPECLRERHPGLVGPVARGQGLEDVRQAENARLHVELLTREALGVAGPVDPFVVCARDRRDVLQLGREGQLLQQVDGGDHVRR